MWAVCNQVVFEGLALSFGQLEYGAVKTTTAIQIFNGEAVVLLMREETNHAPPSIRYCGFSQHHRHAAYLFGLLAKSDVLNSSYAYLFSRTSISLTMQMDYVYSECASVFA